MVVAGLAQVAGKLAQVLEHVDPRNRSLFRVDSTFASNSILLYSCDPVQLQKLVCPGVDVEVVDGHSHVAVAFVDQREFRFRGLPKSLGRDFFMVEYLAFVTYCTADGRTTRGLYLIRSDTPSRLASVGSRVFSHYNFRHIDLRVDDSGPHRRFRSAKAGIDVTIDLSDTTTSDESFNELSRPRSFNFQYLKSSKSVLIIHGVLKNWKPRPTAVVHSTVASLDEFGLTCQLRANSIQVDDVDYRWRNGRIDR